eukprot:522847-Amphidinium_carterae.1
MTMSRTPNLATLIYIPASPTAIKLKQAMDKRPLARGERRARDLSKLLVPQGRGARRRAIAAAPEDAVSNADRLVGNSWALRTHHLLGKSRSKAAFTSRP